MKFVLDFLIQLLSNTSILISLFVLVGMIVKKKGTTDIITSMVKTILGLSVLLQKGNRYCSAAFII